MSFVLGVVGVFILCIVAILMVPGFIETFEDMIYYLFPPKPKQSSSPDESSTSEEEPPTVDSLPPD